MTFARVMLVASLVVGGMVIARPAQAACEVSTTSVTFKDYDVLNSSPSDAEGVVSIVCDATLAVSIQISKGTSPTFLPRTMVNKSDTLQYNLFLDGARSVIWGDGTEKTMTMDTKVSVKIVRTLPVFGRIPSQQDVSSGTYDDTVVVTIIF